MKHETLYLLVILLICLLSLSFVAAQTSQPEWGSGFLKSSLNKFFETLKNLRDIFMNWLQENILPKLKQWYEVKKIELKEEIAKKKQEIGEEIKETIPKIFSGLWREIKELIK